jgi:enamine deaminase RidA (YjgF/YER057c/UK114 family)
MTALTFINPPGLYDPAPNGYSHVAVVEGAARFVFLAGQGGEAADGSLSPDFAVQLNQAMDNIVIALAAANATLRDVVKLTVLVVDHDGAKLEALVRTVRERFEGRPAPACTLIPVPRLALDGMRVEVEATAVAR